jgi:hypothetical protein
MKIFGKTIEGDIKLGEKFLQFIRMIYLLLLNEGLDFLDA